MTALTITAADVHLVRADDDQLLTLPVGEAHVAGQYVRLNTTTGKIELGNATSTTELGNTYGVAFEKGSVGQANTMALPGAILDLGDALSSLAFDAPIYANDADGSLGDAAGTSSRVVARVIPGFGYPTADKLARVV